MDKYLKNLLILVIITTSFLVSCKSDEVPQTTKEPTVINDPTLKEWQLTAFTHSDGEWYIDNEYYSAYIVEYEDLNATLTLNLDSSRYVWIGTGTKVLTLTSHGGLTETATEGFNSSGDFFQSNDSLILNGQTITNLSRFKVESQSDSSLSLTGAFKDTYRDGGYTHDLTSKMKLEFSLN